MPMTSYQRWMYQTSLALLVRSASGTAFQDFFSKVMEKRHGADFLRVRAMGSLGDKGCDGYLQSTGCVFQCFGKTEDAALNVKTLVKKLNDDYALASKHLGAIMKEWHFGHNLVNGVPIEFVMAVEALKTANPQHVIGVIGPAGLEARVFELDEGVLSDLLGPAATAEDGQNLKMEEVAALVASLMVSIDNAPLPDGDPLEVPVDKLETNRLPPRWCGLIAGGMKNAPFVADYLDNHPVPETGKRLASEFNLRYRALKLEGLGPGETMDRLFEAITGIGSVSVSRQVAAVALLAHLFESCDIFEDHRTKVAAA
ncbi:hypothetical protein MMB17_07385 [Methylobacterium organophilum]|uniref:ABC-three component system protein n=1 Tax=Methylobacterium organophilum TaxID=410 RepID=UPI001F128CEF|nr:ABC-three component system protein [Methylobacterium organophilum]UMY19112.1 hypothetical protein MMB17_07385 [Methylobacterium organophilum]